MKVTVNKESVQADLKLQVGDVFETEFGGKRLIVATYEGGVHVINLDNLTMHHRGYIDIEELNRQYGREGNNDTAVKLFNAELNLTVVQEIAKGGF